MSSIFGSISGRSSLTSRKDYKVTVQLLDDNENIIQEFNKNANGQAVLDYVCEYLNIVEKDYFGLRFQDISKHRYWIDLSKPVTKQVRGPNIGLRFRVRFYPANVNVLQEEITRYQLFVQLQRDLLHGRLYCPQNESALLGGLILQSMLGDYDQEERAPDYVSEYKLLLKQTAKIEEKIAEAHKSFKGLTPAEAEMKFLQKASKLDTYGFDPYVVTDKQGQMVYVGVTHKGIFVYQTNRMVHHITWDQLDNVNFVGKELIITPTQNYFSQYVAATSNVSNGHTNGHAQKSNCLKYKCPSGTFAKHLWRHILSQQAFFTESEAKNVKTKFSKPRIPIFSRGASFRYPNPRVLHEIEIQKSLRNGPIPEVVRYPLQKQQPRHLLRDCKTLPPIHINHTIDSTILENEPAMEKNETWEVARGEDERKLTEHEPEAHNDDVNNSRDKKEESSPSGADSPTEKVTTFTIHLCRRDPMQSVSDEEKAAQPDEAGRKNSNVVSVSEIKPLYASTPVRGDASSSGASLPPSSTQPPSQASTSPTQGDDEIVKVDQHQLEAKIEPVEEVVTEASIKNDAKISAQQNTIESNTVPRRRVIAKNMLTVLLIVLLIAALFVAVFESDTNIVDVPIVEDIYHRIYKPVRNYVTSHISSY